MRRWSLAARTDQVKGPSRDLEAKPLVESFEPVAPVPAAATRHASMVARSKGADFDKAYIDHEVAYHQQVRDAINSTLLPNAKNPELKALIERCEQGRASYC